MLKAAEKLASKRVNSSVRRVSQSRLAVHCHSRSHSGHAPTPTTTMHYLTRFNKIAIQGTPQMAVDKEAISLSRVYSLCAYGPPSILIFVYSVCFSHFARIKFWSFRLYTERSLRLIYAATFFRQFSIDLVRQI